MDGCLTRVGDLESAAKGDNVDRKMNVLVTCGRFYPSIALVRALHAAGARIDVADPYKLAPALHSNAVAAMHVVAPPAKEPLRFVDDVAAIVRQRDIDMVVPVFEEGFFLSRYAAMIPAPIFAPAFDTIERLHDKAHFQDVCRELGLRAPRTVTVTGRDDLRAAIARFDQYVARPAFSRTGQTYLTNHGPRAGEITVDDCNPTEDNPWLVQEYIEGKDACSFSIVRDGKVVVHCSYEPTVAAVGGFAVEFTSIDDFGSLEVASQVAEKFGYTGFLGFDFRRTADGFVMIECNPRLTAGSFLTPEDWVGAGVLDTPGTTRIALPGKSRQYDAYILIGNAAHLKPAQMLHQLLTTPDAIMSTNDVLPALYCFINRRHFSHLAEQRHVDLVEAFTGDVAWDGTPMPEPPAHHSTH
jgi:glutathione synthase/RimK-type ligase-like ATP-grasp enzyme